MMMNGLAETLLVGLTGTICALSFYIWWSRRRLRQLASKLPGPKGLPLLGNTLQGTKGPGKSFSFLCDLGRRYQGGPFRLWFGPKLICVITTAEDAKIVLVEENLLNRDEYGAKIMRRTLGNGLGTCRADTWKKQRKIVAPTFYTNSVVNYLDIFNKNSQALVKKLTRCSDGAVFDVYEAIAECTLCSIFEATVGPVLENQRAAIEFFLYGMGIISKCIYIIYTRPWLQFDFFFNMTFMNKLKKIADKEFFSIIDSEIRSKMQEFAKNGQTKTESERCKKLFIDHYISSANENGLPLSESQFQGDVRTLIATGQETTATTLCYTLMMLSLHPEVQEEVFLELKEVFSDDWNRPATVSDIKRLQLLGRVLKETMRLFPLPGFLPREVHKEIKLTDFILPAGCNAYVWPYMIHRDPRYFPDPERFDPDRFLPERCEGRHPYSFIPFGAGPRNCVGYRYAEMQMPIIMGNILKNYRILPACTREDLQKLNFSLIVQPTIGYKVRMIPR